MAGDSDFYAESRFVKELKPDNFDQISTWKLNDKGCAMVLFYCAWCPHCQSIKSEWEKFAEIATFMKVYALNCEKQKGHLEKIKYDMPQLVKGFPTIVIYKNGEPVEHYMEERTSKAFLKRAMCSCQGKCDRKKKNYDALWEINDGEMRRII